MVLTFLLTLQIDFACDVNGEVENPDVAQVSETSMAVGNSCGSCVICAFMSNTLLLRILLY